MKFPLAIGLSLIAAEVLGADLPTNASPRPDILMPTPVASPNAVLPTTAPAAMPMPVAQPQGGVSPAPVVPAGAVSSTSPQSVDYKKFRDPFKEQVTAESMIVKSDLEKFSVTDFKVTGVITGPVRMRAMLLAPDGKTHYVSENMKIGTRDGVIVKITTKTIVVREKVVNPLGEVELFDTEIGIDQSTGVTGPE